MKQAHVTLQTHARTFSAAARWLDADTYDAVASVYLFCRTVDDLADEAADDDALAAIADELKGLRPPSPLVQSLLDLVPRGVPIDAATDLVDGCRADLAPAVRMADERAVIRYGYLVAGTVGRLVAPLLGAHPGAEPFAVDLGIAMQLSNIARDVGEDAERGRVYLPATWLAAAGLSDRDVIEGGRDDAVAGVVGRLLDLAERYYASSDAGLARLPFRGRLVVALASRRYRGMGRKVRARAGAAVRDRTVLGVGERVRWFLTAPWVALVHGVDRGPQHDSALHVALERGRT